MLLITDDFVYHSLLTENVLFAYGCFHIHVFSESCKGDMSFSFC